jgi:ATP-binding cassette, subfamily B, bacterial CvaB/MchF/RaxB
MSLFNRIFLNSRKTLPVIYSTEAAECGLACVAMVGRYYGHHINLNGIREKYPFSISGVALGNLIRLANKLGFGTRALKVEMSALGKVKMPAILHWDLSHFVVLKSITRSGIIIHDPASGKRTLTAAEFSKHFTGVLLELTPAAQFEKIDALTPTKINSLWSHSTGLWSAVAQVLLLSLILQIVTFAAPFQIQLVIDGAIGHSDVSLLNILFIGFALLVIMQAGLEAVRTWAVQIFGNLLSYQMVGNLVRHLLHLPSEFFEKRHIGDILSRVGSTEAIQDALSRGIVTALIDGCMAMIAVAIMFLYSPLLTGIVLAGVAVNLLAALAFFPVMKERQQEQLIASANERSYLMESIRAATTIKLMGREAEREGSWRNLYAKVINTTLSLGRYQISTAAIQSAVTGILTCLVIYFGARSILSGVGFTIGMLYAFLSFRQIFSDRFTSLINQGIQFRLLYLHLERLGDIVAAPVESSGQPVIGLDVEGAISLKSVSFRYSAYDPWVLKDFDLDVAAGEFLAITGRTGCGKTTLLKLMLGLLTPTEGQIFLDGRPATAELWQAWREKVGLVAQDDRLLSGTIADNISFFDPERDMARIEASARASQVHEEIIRKPMQYLSLIGDMGSSLSGGQKQRILLARALYRQPNILLLDEGTANLDQATEAMIGELVSTMTITRIVIAHRPELLQRASRVIVIDATNDSI